MPVGHEGVPPNDRTYSVFQPLACKFYNASADEVVPTVGKLVWKHPVTSPSDPLNYRRLFFSRLFGSCLLY